MTKNDHFGDLAHHPPANSQETRLSSRFVTPRTPVSLLVTEEGLVNPGPSCTSGNSLLATSSPSRLFSLSDGIGPESPLFSLSDGIQESYGVLWAFLLVLHIYSWNKAGTPVPQP